MHVPRLTLFFSPYRWASLLWAMVMSCLSPILAAVWRLAASLLASSSMACPSPFCSTSFPTTTPNWRNRNVEFRTRSAPSSSRNVWGANLTAAANLSQRTRMMTYIIGLAWGTLSVRVRTEQSFQLATSLTLNGLITHGSRKCKTPSASNSEPVWFKNIREEMGAAASWDKL